MYQIIKRRKIWLSISASLMIISAVSLFLWHLKFGIDFTGGSYLEVQYQGETPSVGAVQEKLSSLELGSLTAQPVGDQGLILRFQNVSEEKHQEVIKALGELGQSQTEGQSAVEELKFDSIGPSIGQELKRKSFNAIVFVLLGIILYIGWSFRQVSRPVQSWKYGAAAIIALIHDALIVLGAFAVLGRFYGVEVNSPFIAALLTVIGFSVHDTIVVFDRIRENLPKSDEDFEGTVNASLNQTLARSIITSGTVLLVLIAIYFFGGESIKDFALALLIGVFFGTYSSIFLASPLLILWEKMGRKN